MPFKLARQTQSENPWELKSWLLSYYQAAQISDQKRFTEVFKKGVNNNKLRKMLIVHEPLLVTMATCKVSVHCYQISLLQYIRSTISLASAATAGLRMLHQEKTNYQRKNLTQLKPTNLTLLISTSMFR